MTNSKGILILEWSPRCSQIRGSREIPSDGGRGSAAMAPSPNITMKVLQIDSALTNNQPQAKRKWHEFFFWGVGVGEVSPLIFNLAHVFHSTHWMKKKSVEEGSFIKFLSNVSMQGRKGKRVQTPNSDSLCLNPVSVTTSLLDFISLWLSVLLRELVMVMAATLSTHCEDHRLGCEKHTQQCLAPRKP